MNILDFLIIEELQDKLRFNIFRIPTITSPYDDGIPGNPVGNLQELCISHRWAPPSYLLNGENGLPHEREFVITCIVENYTEIGAGKSKKLAKRQAAYRMLMRVKDTPIESANQGVGLEDEDEVSFLFFHVAIITVDFY